MPGDVLSSMPWSVPLSSWRNGIKSRSRRCATFTHWLMAGHVRSDCLAPEYALNRALDLPRSGNFELSQDQIFCSQL